MPGTAQERGLADPFDPEQAIPAAAHFLSDLRTQFGNLGLAAAAYNGGPNRVSAWLAGKASLAAETRDYVIRITGRAAEEWKGHRDSGDQRADDPQQSCTYVTANLRVCAPPGMSSRPSHSHLGAFSWPATFPRTLRSRVFAARGKRIDLSSGTSDLWSSGRECDHVVCEPITVSACRPRRGRLPTHSAIDFTRSGVAASYFGHDERLVGGALPPARSSLVLRALCQRHCAGETRSPP
jgi:hypothetical protein